jgi:hypothetical protein
MISESKLSANLWFADTLGSFRYSLSLHALFFVLEIPDQAGTSQYEDDSRFPGKGL